MFQVKGYVVHVVLVVRGVQAKRCECCPFGVASGEMSSSLVTNSEGGDCR